MVKMAKIREVFAEEEFEIRIYYEQAVQRCYGKTYLPA